MQYFILYLILMVVSCQTAGKGPGNSENYVRRPVQEVVRGDTLMEWGKTQKAIDQYIKAITENPDRMNPYLKLAEAYIQNGLYVEALDVYNRGIERIPDSPELLTGLGKVYFLQNQMTMAELNLLQALELNNHYVPAYVQLAQVYYIRDSLSAAIRFAHLAAQSEPDNAKIWDKLGDYCMTAQEWDLADEAYNKALSLHYMEGKTYEKLGDLNYRRTRITEIAQDKEDIYFIGISTPNDPMLQEALQWGRHLLLRYPYHASLNNNMGVLWWNYGRIDSAIVQFRNALNQAPRHEAARNNLAGAMLQKGYRNRAIAEYEKVLHLNPGNAATLESLGDYYEAN